MNRSFLYVALGALVVVVIALSCQYYQERQRGAEIQIDVSNASISVETK